LELEAVIDPAVNARAIAIAASVAGERLAGVRDVIPTYRSVAVHFDPLAADVEMMRASLRRAADAAPDFQQGSLIEVPVAYGGAHGPDLQDVATFAKLSPQAVIERHCAVEYRVFMLGFLPGFAYMGSVDPSIAAPRKATPRARIPAGSVGIAGRQTGIYPRQSPGGWQLIGRTALRVFDATRVPAALIAAGDRVKFVPTALLSGADPSGPRSDREPERFAPHGRSITVLRPGLFTTIQDSGRWGHQDRGVPVAGPMDWSACRLANALVGNALDAAALEVTLVGPELRFEKPSVFAVTGADLSASLDGAPLALESPQACAGGSVLRFGERRSGTRAYIAADGGIDVPRVLGSRATHVVSGLGGIDGRALAAGDRLPLGETQDTVIRGPKGSAPRGGGVVMRRGPFGPAKERGARLRVMRGPQDDYFDEAAFDTLQRTRFTISPQSDRMGYRLVGGSERKVVMRRPGPFGPGEMISDATFMGGLQIPPSGDPILLMADRQTTGGYPQIATVITADLPLAGQLAPGDWLEFTLCTRVEAIAALVEEEERLRAV
jgi:KipI family sensor histidine kinase inhibitor